MRVHYTYQNPAGCIYHVRVDNVASWADEPYPPGGFLRVMRDAGGRMLAGPHVDELISWAVQYAEWMDNARLIAAAPDLLAVLKEVADYWAGGDVPAELDARMRAVIAAATGEV